MLHAKFQDHWNFSSPEDNFKVFLLGYLGHVTKTIFIIPNQAR